MNTEERIAAARDLLDNPLTLLILAEMEQSAVDTIISADPRDHDKRAAFAAEARAIRDFRDKLNQLTQEAKVTETRAPA